MSELLEIWTEIRCPGCRSCGWENGRLLFKISGIIPITGAKLQTRCNWCKSLVEWQIGTPRITTVIMGTHRRKSWIRGE